MQVKKLAKMNTLSNGINNKKKDEKKFTCTYVFCTFEAKSSHDVQQHINLSHDNKMVEENVKPLDLSDLRKPILVQQNIKKSVNKKKQFVV